MKKILNIKQAFEIAKSIKGSGKTLVVAGGCFDILHPGHIKFLKLAKREGDFLFVLLESDENVRKIKGKSRPLNRERERAAILSSLPIVDYVVLLPVLTKNFDYDVIIKALKPDVLATTVGEEGNYHLKRQAKQINARVVYVTERFKDYSTTKFANLIKTYGL